MWCCYDERENRRRVDRGKGKFETRGGRTEDLAGRWIDRVGDKRGEARRRASECWKLVDGSEANRWRGGDGDTARSWQHARRCVT